MRYLIIYLLPEVILVLPSLLLLSPCICLNATEDARSSSNSEWTLSQCKHQGSVASVMFALLLPIATNGGYFAFLWFWKSSGDENYSNGSNYAEKFLIICINI
jgi:hypothetical protein